jgi:gas vesicle protein
MNWRLTPWWEVLLDGFIGAAFGGLVAAMTAWLVVNLTSKRQRKDALVSEARQALLRFYILAEELRHVAVDDQQQDTAELRRRLTTELAGVRALVVAASPSRVPEESPEDTELRILTYEFLAGVTNRASGGSSVLTDPYAKLRKYLKELIRQLGE